MKTTIRPIRRNNQSVRDTSMSTAPIPLILKSFLSPGDIVMLTAAVRDLHAAYPGRFLTDVRTSAPALWENNPYLVPLEEDDPAVAVIDMHYPLIHQSNMAPYHFIHGYARYLEDAIRRWIPDARIPVTQFKGDIHISPLEKSWMSQVEELEHTGPFWILVAGGKRDFTAKWWNPDWYQEVVDHFQGRIQFVQCGDADHWHPRLDGVIDLIGKTDLRQFVRLVYHADGVLCPVTLAMHMAAAVAVKPGKLKNRSAVVIAGGREPSQWEAYPHHQYLHTNGALPCCDQGGCWKSRVVPLGDGDEKDHSLCLDPVEIASERFLPRCLELIHPDDVIRAVELFVGSGSSYTQGLDVCDVTKQIV